jgi:hypothetical protein
MKWPHKLRGFCEDYSPGYNPHENPLEQDFSHDILASHDLKMKCLLLSEQTAYQHVDVFEWHNPSKCDPDSYKTETFRLAKGLYLDRVQQSSLCGEAAYHEALVHPGMFPIQTRSAWRSSAEERAPRYVKS